MGHRVGNVNTRAARRRSFLWHLATFTWVMALLAGLDIAGGGDYFIQWVAAIWGPILGVHFADAFILGGFLGFHVCAPVPEDEQEPRGAGSTAR